MEDAVLTFLGCSAEASPEGRAPPLPRAGYVRRRALLLFALAFGCGEATSDDASSGRVPVALGRAVVRVGLVDARGAPVDCRDTSVEGFSVELGRALVERACGEAPEVAFDDLTPGRYPVDIALVSDGARLDRHIDNLVVDGGRTTSFSHVFEVLGETGGRGTVTLRWLIDGEAPQTSCSRVGASRAQVRVLEGPDAPVERELPCTAETLTLNHLRAGLYRVELVLLDESGVQVGFTSEDPGVRVTSSQTEEIVFDIEIERPPGARSTFLGLWTVNSTSASVACERFPSNQVEVALRPDMPGAATLQTATAACAAGGLALVDISPDTVVVEAAFRLFDTAGDPALLDLRTVGGIRLEPAETASASVDFKVER